MNIKEIIQKLKDFDLKVADPSEITAFLEQLGDIMVLGIEIPVGDFIIRGVPDATYEKGRHYEKQISYISDPSIKIRENRASIEGRRAHYGTTTRGNENFNQSVCIYECATILNKPQDDNVLYQEYITMGKWRVIKPITVVAIVYKKDFLEVNSDLKGMHESFLEYSKAYPKKTEDILVIADFLAEEFSKHVNDDERYKYKISNLFAEIIYNRGAMGLIYPSVKGEGKCFNLVLTKETVDYCLKLEKVLVWKVMKRNTNVVMLPQFYCDTFDEDGKFRYIDVPQDTPEHALIEMLFKE